VLTVSDERRPETVRAVYLPASELRCIRSLYSIVSSTGKRIVDQFHTEFESSINLTIRLSICVTTLEWLMRNRRTKTSSSVG